MNHLELQRVFEIQKSIDEAVKTLGYSVVDSGMMLEQDSPIERDVTLESKDGEEYYFAFNTNGDVKGKDELPLEIQTALTIVMGCL